MLRNKPNANASLVITVMGYIVYIEYNFLIIKNYYNEQWKEQIQMNWLIENKTLQNQKALT